jgi:hypothetical protein
MIKRIFAFLLLAFLFFSTQSSYADWQDALDNAWQNTKEVSESAYEKSKEYTNDALDKSKNYYDGLSVDTEPSDQVTPDSIQQQKKQHIQVIWKDVLNSLDQALDINTQIDTAPVSRFFGADKKSLTEDQIDVFEIIEALLSDPAIAKNRENIERLKDNIKDKKNTIAGYMEKRVVADNDDRIEYDQKIKKIKEGIEVLAQRINHQKDNLKKRFNASGLLLSDRQVDVLLSRVDADDIITMSLVYDVLKDITVQLMGLTKESHENIDQARRYYGMHVVLLKLVLHMQDNYIKKLEEDYLPKIELIRMETRRINEESTHLLATEMQRNRKVLLHKNLKAQQLTLKVAKLYAQQLRQQKEKVEKAQKLILNDYKVAKNTYDTVKINADLIQLMKTNRTSFNALMNIQLPEIMPFENLAMQRKFEELSSMIK